MLTTRRLLYNGVLRPYLYAFAYMIFGVLLFSCLEQLHEEILEDDAESEQCDNDEDDSFWERTEDKIRDFLRLALAPPNTTTASVVATTNATADIATTDSITEAIRSIRQPWKAPHRSIGKMGKPLKFAVPKKWSVEKSFRFVEALLTSIGYGDVVPLSPAAKLITIVYAAVGLPIFLNAISSTQDTLNDIIDRWLLFYAKIRNNSLFANAKLATAATLWVSYLHMGSLMFSSIFEHWSYETAFYFCFISLTTIGFGDYVPSTLTGVQTLDVDAVLDAKSHHAAFETVKPMLLILLRHAYTFIGLSLTAFWFDVLKNYFKGRLFIPVDSAVAAQMNGEIKGANEFYPQFGDSTNTGTDPYQQQQQQQQQHHSHGNSYESPAHHSYFNQQLADINAGSAGNYGGPPPCIVKHLLARYSSKDQLRATFASPSLSSPGESTPRSGDRSPSPFRASIIEKVVRL